MKRVVHNHFYKTMKQSIHLGFEVGTGKSVEIPIHHLAVTGQTQEAGKTTTLEALVSRSGIPTIVFVTKRFEQSFGDGHTIPPYFRERADWQFVASILEATLRERMKFQRSWIMKLCEARREWPAPCTLADVQRNVEIALKTARGIHEGVYTELRSYLQLVVPQIELIPFSKDVNLGPGLNVMDLADYSLEMQSLIIQSVLDWVYHKADNTIVVIPEAWEFIPRKRGSPVKLAAEQLIRKGAGGRNYVWLDSQDIASMDGDIRKSIVVWLLGVQREANEVKRTLAHIPLGSPKPTVKDVMTLEKGQFFVCHGKVMLKVYVQPAWMESEEAREIAAGKRILLPSEVLDRERKEPTVTEAEAKRLEAENERLKREKAELQKRIESLKGEEHLRSRPPRDNQRPPAISARQSNDLDGDEALYLRIKARFIDDLPEMPEVLRILAQRPEIEVEIKRETVTISADTPEGWIARLIAEGFFNNVSNGNSAFNELKRRGARLAKPSAYDWCRRLVRKGFLTEETKGSFRAVAGMKINIVEK